MIRRAPRALALAAVLTFAACSGGGGQRRPHAEARPRAHPGAAAAAAAPADAARPSPVGTDAGRSTATPTGRPVLLVSIDGLRPDAIAAAGAPTLMRLLAAGAHSLQARTVDPSLTLPSHASMMSGYPPSVHGILWNELRPGYLSVPTVFTAARQAGLRTVMVVGKDKMEQFAPPDDVTTFVLAPDGDLDVAEHAALQARRGFDLMFVHFPMVDLTGHGQGWMSEAYLEQVAETDRALALLLGAVSPLVTVIVTSDHGGMGFTHGSTIAEDMTIPWIIHGPRVRKGQVIAAPIATTDTAATIAHILGVSLSPEQIGRPVRDAFLP